MVALPHLRPLLGIALVMASADGVSGCSGCGKSGGEERATSVATKPDLSVVDVAVGARGFIPNEVRWTRGTPLSLVFKRTSDEACGTEVTLPDVNVRRQLPLNEAVTVAVPSSVPGKYEFRCGSSAYAGHVFVL
jgi:plastocyanin domain-containing protein